MLNQRNIITLCCLIAICSLYGLNPASAQQNHDHDHDHEHKSQHEEEHAHQCTLPADEYDHQESETRAEHDHEELITLDPETEKLIGLQTQAVQITLLEKTIYLTGKIQLNQDELAHIVPLVPGVVQQVHATLGSTVKTGQVMAMIHSRELSEAKAEYLAARQRQQLAESLFKRENQLWQQKITSEQEFILARNNFAETEINLMLAEQKLRALGLSAQTVNDLPRQDRESFIKYEITAPFDGIVIDKHITLGELVRPETSVFTIANLDTVWIDLDIFPKDLPHIHPGQECQISIAGQSISGPISFIGPVLDPVSRTAIARVIIPNPSGQLRPGLFVNAIIFSQGDTGIIIPTQAVQNINGEECVFVGLAPRLRNQRGNHRKSQGPTCRNYGRIEAWRKSRHPWSFRPQSQTRHQHSRPAMPDTAINKV